MISLRIKQASSEMSKTVYRITQETIDAIYPHYYPAGAVAFFKAHHSMEKIQADVRDGLVWLLYQDESPVGTVTVGGNHILRLFVLPAYQHRGYGRALLDFAEAKIFAEHAEAELDASFPAKAIYRMRGYVGRAYHTIRTENGDVLCYDVMAKSRPDPIQSTDDAKGG